MKKLYEFQINKKEIVEESATTTQDGAEVTTKKKVEKEIAHSFFVRRPNRTLVDESKLFYMMSRGIDEKSAKKQIVEGFFDPILVKIDNDVLKENIKSSISERLGAIV